MLLVLTAMRGGAQAQRFFIADSDDDEIYRYTEAVTASGNWDTNASGNGSPSDVHVDNTHVYVLDSTDDRVYRYTYAGGSATMSRMLRSGGGNDLANMLGLAVYEDQLWITEGGDTLRRYSLSAAFTGATNYNSLNSYGLNSNNSNPTGIAVDATYLYVLDGTDRQFYRYSRTTPGTATASRTLRSSGGVNLTGCQGAFLDGTNMYVVRNSFGDDSIHVFPLASLFTGSGDLDATQSWTLPTANNLVAGVGVNPIPTVTSIVRLDPNPTNAATVQFQVTFSEPVTGVDTTDFALAVVGLSGSSIASVSADTGNTRVVTVNTGLGEGTLGLNFADDDTVVDIGNLPIGGAGLGNGNFTGEVYDVDTLPPSVSSIVRADANPTNASTVNFTVTFSESVTGVAAANFTVDGSGVTGSVGTVTGSGTTWNVPVGSVSGDGTLSVDLDQNLANIQDGIGNALAAAHTAGEAYDVDQTAPSVVSIVRADANPTNASTVNFTVTFSESVTGVAAANFTVDGSGVTGTVGTVTGSGTTWNVPVESVTGDGTVSVDLDQALSGVEDAVGNALAAAYTAGEAYDVDQTAPSSSSSVDDWTRAGAAVLDIDFASSDAGSGVASTVLYVKEPGSDTFADTGLSEAGDSGTFSYAPPSGLEGLYEFATVATDNAGNAESAPPAAASAVVLLNDEANTTFTQAVVTGDDVLVFPMTDALDTTITLSGATAGSTVTVVRHSPRATPPAFFSGPLGELLDESLSIEGEGLGSFTATIEWGFDAGSAPTIDQVWQFNGGTLTATYPVTPSGNVLTIPGVTGFSDWFSGNGVAVPVGLSTFSID